MLLIGVVGTGFLSPDEPDWTSLLVFMTASQVGLTILYMLGPSLLSDIIDYGTWKFGTDQTATYFSLYVMTHKISLAIGGSIGLALAGWYGFDPSTTAHTVEAGFGVRLAIAWLPAFILLISIPLMTLISISAYRHKIIRRRLDTRAARQITTNPIQASVSN